MYYYGSDFSAPVPARYNFNLSANDEYVDRRFREFCDKLADIFSKGKYDGVEPQLRNAKLMYFIETSLFDIPFNCTITNKISALRVDADEKRIDRSPL